MKQTLEDLRFSYLIDSPVKRDRERKKMLEEIDKLEDKLRAQLSERQIGELNDYEDSMGEICSLDEKEAFIKGVRFAVRFMIEALCRDCMNTLPPRCHPERSEAKSNF